MTTTFRKLALSAFLSVAAIGSVTMTSCKKEDKVCDAGYEGTDCKTLSSAKFVGTYSVTEDCGGSYNITITASSATPTSVIFSNLGNFAVATPAVVTAAADQNKLTFTNFSDATGRKFTGTGTLTGTKLVVDYKVTYSDGTSESCVSTMAKQ
jgi:hypothetical protein